MWCAQPLPCKHAGAQASGAHPKSVGSCLCRVLLCKQMHTIYNDVPAPLMQSTCNTCCFVVKQKCLDETSTCLPTYFAATPYTYTLISTLYRTLLSSADSGIGHRILNTKKNAWFYLTKRFTSPFVVLLSICDCALCTFRIVCFILNRTQGHNARTVPL